MVDERGGQWDCHMREEAKDGDRHMRESRPSTGGRHIIEALDEREQRTRGW